jgi:hypothetical protein
MNSLHLSQKINGPSDLAGSETSDENRENQLVRAVSLDSACLRMDEQPNKTVIPGRNGNFQLNDVSVNHLTSRGGPAQNDMVIDLTPSASEQRLTVPLEASTWIASSFTELEAAGVLLALPKGGTRSAATTPQRNSSEATPKASQSQKTNIGPSKSHKRSHSKVNDALHKEVRKQLQAAAAETVEIYDEDLEYTSKPEINPPIQKEKQLPFRSWADVKVPILQGEDCNKRYCATEQGRNGSRGDVSPEAPRVGSSNGVCRSICFIRFGGSITRSLC